MTYTLGVTYNVPVFIKTCLPHSLITSGPESSSSLGVVGTSYLSTLKLAGKQQAQATHPWPEANYLAPHHHPSRVSETQAFLHSRGGRMENERAKREAGLPMAGPHQDGNLARINSVAPGKSPAEFPQLWSPRGLCFF